MVLKTIQSEEFILDSDQVWWRQNQAGSGLVVRTLADGAIAIAGRAAGFDEAIKDGHLPPRK